MKTSELKSLIKKIILKVKSRGIISEKVDTRNERLLWQLALAISQNKLRIKIEENDFPFDEEIIGTQAGSILITVLDTPYSLAVDFNFDISEIKSTYSGSRNQSSDPDYFILDSIEIKVIYLYKDGSETLISLAYPSKFFALYLVAMLAGKALGNNVETDDYLVKIEKKLESDFREVKIDLDVLKDKIVSEVKKNAKR